MANIRQDQVLPSVKASQTTLADAAAEAIYNAIREGTFAPGSQLPPEKTLMPMLGVSRATLREALRTLEERMFIVRKRGRGTYVAETPIIKNLSNNFGITEMIAQAGHTPGARSLRIREETASASVATALAISEGAPVLSLDRVRTANLRPVVWSQDIIPIELLGDDRLEQFSAHNQSLYDYLHASLGLQVVQGIAQLRPVAATPDIAARLEVRPGGPLMCVTQTDYDADGRPIIYSIEHHLPDAFVFVIKRKGPY
jgi:DNA-binding GntR family transcriptional regulator